MGISGLKEILLQVVPWRLFTDNRQALAVKMSVCIYVFYVVHFELQPVSCLHSTDDVCESTTSSTVRNMKDVLEIDR